MRKDGEDGWDRWRCGRCVGYVGCVNGDTPLRSCMKKYIHCCYENEVSKKLFRSIFVKIVSKNELDLMLSLPK